MSAEPESPFEGVAVVRLRPLYFVLVATVLTALIALGTRATGGAELGHALIFVLTWGVLSFAALAPLSRAGVMKRAISGSVGVREDHLTVDGKALAHLGAITSALIVPGKGDDRTVRLTRSGRPAIELRVPDEDQAAALLHALGLGPAQWAASYELPFQSNDPRRHARAVLSLAGMFFNFAAMSRFDHWGLGSALALLCWTVSIPAAFRPRLRVGTDGISLIRTRRPRFVPHEEIADVEADTTSYAALTITLTSGKTLELATEDGQAEQIADRILDAKDALEAGVDPHPTLLSRVGTPKDRIRALRALGQEGKQGYRAAPVPTEQLWRIFESAAHDAETRAGAAVALRERLDASSLRRLRIVAAATASPKLRTAIESAASDDDTSLEDALAALKQEAANKRAVRRVKAR